MLQVGQKGGTKRVRAEHHLSLCGAMLKYLLTGRELSWPKSMTILIVGDACRTSTGTSTEIETRFSNSCLLLSFKVYFTITSVDPTGYITVMKTRCLKKLSSFFVLFCLNLGHLLIETSLYLQYISWTWCVSDL